ncbi:hypothetical protein ACFE04_018282 [Oxalis oulophora]
MGSSSSKTERNEALHLCKERRRFIKQAIDSRFALAASHVSYTQSLKNIGIALRRYAEAEILIESSLSTSVNELDNKTPSRSPSPSPSHVNETPFSTPPMGNVSYMRQMPGPAVTVSVNASFMDDESMEPFPGPPPPPFESGSWDYFNPNTDDCESFRFPKLDMEFDDMRGWRQQYYGNSVDSKGICAKDGLESKHIAPALSDDSKSLDIRLLRSVSSQGVDGYEQVIDGSNGGKEGLNGNAGLQNSNSEKSVGETDLSAEREDPSEFITHRAKDFLSSIKDIEHRFFRASEAGREVSRMLEANKIRVGYSEAKEPAQNGTKVITWKRSTSSRSSSSRNPLAAANKDDNDDSGSDFVEEFCMIAGSHSSTLDRLFAWERKLYDEVKASESIRKEYDTKCDQLRHQFAKDLKAHVIDKTRATVKDLHSRIRVGLQSVDSISKRIEKMRDEELQPQLLELIQGLIRMWKAMLESHHSQYITISLAYHARAAAGTPQGDTSRQIMAQLREEIECFGLSFADWVNSLTSYVEALNGWLQHCILLPQERSKSKRPFSPRRVLAPPIFVLCRDWSAGINSLPSEELSGAIKTFLTDICCLMDQHAEHQHNNESREAEIKDDDKNENENVSSNLCSIHASLTKVLERVNKFSEASLKMYEDIRLKSEVARVAYLNGRPSRF